MSKVISSGELKHLRRSNVVISESGQPELKEEWDRPPGEEAVYDEELAMKKASDVIGVSPSQFVEFAVRVREPTTQQLIPFSFTERRYLKLPYDVSAKRTLYKCGRQVEKSLHFQSSVSLADGRLVPALEVKVGDELATMATDGVHSTTGFVSWVSKLYVKPCIKVTTRQGHSIVIAFTHPMRFWGRWADGAELKVGDRLAAVRQAGCFTNKVTMPDERVRLTAYLIGDGHIGTKAVGFTSMPGATLDEFLSDVRMAGGTYGISKTKGRALQARLHQDGQVHSWMKEDGLTGTKSATKFIPSWVFGLSREQSALFLNRLWSTDGHVKRNGPSKYSIEYCSISERLVKQVQALLWKFGIPSKIRENWPSIYKRRGEKKFAYILRVETQEGVRRFLTDVGALGKVEDVEVPELGSNNNRDTFPEEVNDLIRQVIDSRGDEGRRGCQAEKGKSLRTAGLRETLKYPPTMEKVRQYVAFFRSDERYDQQIVGQLEGLLSTDLYWDEIVSIEDVGDQTCIDFAVEETHNFVAEGLVTHNSTLLGNKCISYAAIHSSFNILYVSPTNAQTKVFSHDRLKEPIDTSEILKAWTTTKLADNVFLKKFVNRSQITLRYAYHNADRVRGIPSDMILIDEIQDIITDNIPVIEESASHSPFKIFIYAGTPKSYDNTLEKYWSEHSTQNEWAIPCERHGTPGDSSSWHWNILAEPNIGKEGLICDKCGGRINPMHPKSQWVSMNPRVRDELKEPYEGFRIPQLMVPWLPWGEILDKYRTYARDKFFNEVLGLSYDSGTRPLRREDVIQNCRSGYFMSEDSLKRVRSLIGQANPVWAGIDWGTGTEHSFTVLSLGTYLNDRFFIFYIHRFEGPESEPVVQLQLIEDILKYWNVNHVGSDYGGGVHQNDHLARALGKNKIWPYQYSTPSQKVRFEPLMHRFLVHRTEVMKDVFEAIKRGDVFGFPDWLQFEKPFGQDMLNIFSEYIETQRMIKYDAPPDKTDDTFHSLLYCFLVSMITHPRYDVLNPSSKTTGAEG